MNASARRQEQERLYERTLGPDALARQKRDAATKCKSCGAPIRWGITRNGKRMPLNYDETPEGNVFLFGDDGCRVGNKNDPTPVDATRHTSHFATCPNAGAHRKQLEIVESA